MRGWFGWKSQHVKGTMLECLADAEIYFMDLKAVTPSTVKVRAGHNVTEFKGRGFADLEMGDLDEFLETEPDVDVYGSVGREDDEVHADDDEEGQDDMSNDDDEVSAFDF